LVSLDIDGVIYSSFPTAISRHQNVTTIYFDVGPPNGSIRSVIINGADHLTCGADRLTLPGAIVAPAPVPTLSEWATILLGGMLAGGAALTLQRRRAA